MDINVESSGNPVTVKDENGLPSEMSSLMNKKENEYVAASSNLKEKLPPGVEEVSIYDVRTPISRKLVLGAAAMIVFLIPLCETIYLPAIKQIAIDLNTNITLVALTMSIYFIMLGLSSLIWGCVSDRFGRKKTMLISLVIFTGASLGCIFTPTIAVFIVLRAIQGATISTTLVVGQAIVADIYPHSKRGFAVALFFVPFTIGPVIGPLLGGILAHYYSWRVSFIFLTSYSAFVTLLMLFFVPETHQYYVKESYNKANPTKRILDAEPNELLPFQKPWRPLIYLGDLELIPYIAVMSTTFATLYSSLTLFSIFLSGSPYSLTQLKIGILYIPGGVAMFISSVAIGWLSDKAAKYYGASKCPEGRLVPPLTIAILHPIGLLIFGWTYEFRENIGGILAGFILLGIGQAVLEPSGSAYLTVMRQKEAGAVAAANAFLMTVSAGIFLSFTVPLESAMQAGPFSTLIACIDFVSIGLAFIPVIRSIMRSARLDGEENKSKGSLMSRLLNCFKRKDQGQYQPLN